MVLLLLVLLEIMIFDYCCCFFFVKEVLKNLEGNYGNYLFYECIIWKEFV